MKNIKVTNLLNPNIYYTVSVRTDFNISLIGDTITIDGEKDKGEIPLDTLSDVIISHVIESKHGTITQNELEELEDRLVQQFENINDSTKFTDNNKRIFYYIKLLPPDVASTLALSISLTNNVISLAEIEKRVFEQYNFDDKYLRSFIKQEMPLPNPIMPHQGVVNDIGSKRFEMLIFRTLAPLYAFVGIVAGDRGDSFTQRYYSDKDVGDDLRSKKSAVASPENGLDFFETNYWFDTDFFRMLYTRVRAYKNKRDEIWNNFTDEIFQYILSDSLYGMLIKCYSRLENPDAPINMLIKHNHTRNLFATFVSVYLSLTEGILKPERVYNNRVQYRVINTTSQTRMLNTRLVKLRAQLIYVIGTLK